MGSTDAARQQLRATGVSIAEGFGYASNDPSNAKCNGWNLNLSAVLIAWFVDTAGRSDTHRISTSNCSAEAPSLPAQCTPLIEVPVERGSRRLACEINNRIKHTRHDVMNRQMATYALHRGV
jgi:hypothetical protein